MEEQIPKASHKKAIILTAVVFVLCCFLTVGVFLFLRSYSGKQTGKYTGKTNFEKLVEDKKVASVAILDSGVNPSTVTIKPGMAVSFANLTKEDVNISIIGSIYVALPLKAGSVFYTPVFETPGEYSFSDKDRKFISGKIVVLQKDPPKLSQREISITNSGFIPNSTMSKKNIAVKFINKTNSDQEVVSTGNLSLMSGVIKPGESWEAKIFEPLDVSFHLKNNPTVTGVLKIE